MELVYTDTEGLPLLSSGGTHEIAANDSGKNHQRAHYVADVNMIVVDVVSRIVARVPPRKVNIEMDVQEGGHMVDLDPTEVAFAMSGVLVALLKSMEEADGGRLRVETRADPRTSRIIIVSEDIPPLGLVRAVGDEEDEPTTGVDPTMRHCRNLVETQGGRLELSEEGGLVGFSLTFPTLPVHNPVKIVPTSFIRVDETIDALETANAA